VQAASRTAMRFLHAGLFDYRARLANTRAGRDERAHPRSTVGQLVSLHRIYQYRGRRLRSPRHLSRRAQQSRGETALSRIQSIETVLVQLPTRREHKWTGLTEPIGRYL